MEKQGCRRVGAVEAAYEDTGGCRCDFAAYELGWGSRQIAAELGLSRNTVKRYLRQGG